MRLEDMSFYDYLLAECEYREKQRRKEKTMNDVEELVIFHAKEIAKILEDTELYIQGGVSDYNEQRAMINAYEQIVDTINAID